MKSVAPKGDGVSPARRLGAADAASFESHVVPRYMAFFGERMKEAIVRGPDARVCHLQCRTGYPDRTLFDKLPDAHIYGCDPSEHAIVIARREAKTVRGGMFDYRVVDGYAVPFPDGAFSHAFTLHPLAAPEERRRMLDELARIVAPRGQALVAMPLRGSFVEIADLLRECAVKREDPALGHAVEAAALLRPTEEGFQKELEDVGFEHVKVDMRARTLRFKNGRDFFEDPVTRIMLLPEFRVNVGPRSDFAFDYVADAIDKYWSDATFELTVNVGVVSGRRRA